jgi:hypothetical protein
VAWNHHAVDVLSRVRARNLATASNNKIHDDVVARRYGFAGGLVPGVDVYAYMTHAVVAHFGPRWLEDGAVDIRFEQPVYDGRWTTVERDVTAPIDDTLALVVRDEDGEQCAIATARMGAGARPTLDDTPLPRLPDTRPVASSKSLPAGAPLGAITTRFDAHRATEYLDGISETLSVYRDDGVAHPGWLLRRANRILAANVSLGPWIHVGSDVRLFDRVHDGERVCTRARVVRVWDRRGHKFVTLDVVVGAGDEGHERVVMQTDHTAIYEPRTREPGPTG